MPNEENKDPNTDDAKPRVLLFGSYIYYTLYNSLGPVVPGQTNSATDARKFGGSAYIMARILQALGVNPLGIVFISGTDTIYPLMESELARQNIQIAVNMVAAGQRTPSGCVIQDPDGNVACAAIEDGIYRTMTAQMLAQYLKPPHVDKLLSAPVWVLDGSFSPDVYTYLSTFLASVKNPPDLYVTLTSPDVKKVEAILSKTKGLFCTVDQIRELVDGPFDSTHEGIWSNIQALAKKTGIESIFATDGAKNVYTLSHAEQMITQMPPVQNVVNGTGALEALAATAIKGLLDQDLSLKTVVDRAVAAAELFKQGLELSEENFKKRHAALAIEERMNKKRPLTSFFNRPRVSV